MTPRAVALGLFFAAALCAFTPYNDFKVAATYISGNQFPIGALFILFFFSLAVNGFLRRFAPARVFRPSELLTIWTLILVASGIPSSGMMRYLIPNIAAPQYLSTSINNWEQRVWGEGTPSWLRLSDPAAAQAFISGYPRGQEQVPWGAWITPLFFWGILAGLFTVATFCVSNLLRRQWVENERFAFPLVALPVLVAAEPPPGRSVNDLFRSPLFWVAVAMVTIYHGIRGMHQMYPSIPDIPQIIPLSPYFTSPPWNSIGSFELRFYPLVMGLAYLLPSDVCFSLWFFYLFYKAQLIYAASLNYETQGALISYEAHLFHGLEAFGGGLALLSWIAWTGRRHFRDVWEKAVGAIGSEKIDDSGEMFSYRATILGLVISYGGIALWLYAAGVPGLYTVSTLLMLTLALVTIAWLVSQAGMLFAQQPYCSIDILAPTLGTSSLKIPALYTMTRFEYSFLFDTREMLTPSVLMGTKVGDASDLDLRSLFRAMAASVALGIVISAIVSVTMPYMNGGGDNLKNPFMYRAAPTKSLSFLAGIGAVPYKGTWTNSLHIVGGYAGVLALFFARARFGLGLHPIGFLVASIYGIRSLWSSIFFGWLFKSIVQRYSGMKGFQAALPFFLGLILGDALNAVIWIALGYATGVGYQVMPD
ncbi:MAG: DUF6785 family protein [Armatimonadota bacterium]